jgi:hypothetical protein
MRGLQRAGPGVLCRLDRSMSRTGSASRRLSEIVRKVSESCVAKGKPALTPEQKAEMLARMAAERAATAGTKAAASTL